MKRLRYSPEALADVEGARDWYDGQLPGLGTEFLDEVDAAIARVMEHPLAFPVVDGSIRRVLLKRFPYALFYDPELEVILAVMHVRRRPNAWRER